MRHTFQLSFISHTNSKRKYCFSVPDSRTRLQWGQALQRQIAQTRSLRAKQEGTQLRQVAEAVSIQVLRDALIPNRGGLPVNHISPVHDLDQTVHLNGNENESRIKNGRLRQGSVSTTYQHTAIVEEAELGPLQPVEAAIGGEGINGLVDVQTGKELVLLCRQNSLLPSLLELLTSGRDDISISGKAMGPSKGEGRKIPMAGRF